MNVTKKFVSEVFSSVATKYDLMNDIMSFGMHRVWKNKLMNHINPRIDNNTNHILDLAGGTGDVAIKISQHFSNIKITVCDLNIEMLELGKEKAINRGIIDINWVCGDAEAMPFKDNIFDYCTVCFGIRNMQNKEQALSEILRTLKPGGKMICMEFSPSINNGIFKTLYQKYSDNLIPQIGKLVAQDKESYKYLVESIKHFPDKNKFAKMIAICGFDHIEIETLMNGLVCIHTGKKINQ